MRVLVTGAAGFVGRHLAAELRAHSHTPIGLDCTESEPRGTAADRFVRGDLRDADFLFRTVLDTEPEACVHLAAMASVPACAADPGDAFAVNVNGTLNLLEALQTGAPGARLLVVSSAHVYASGPSDGPIPERAVGNPSTVYGLTKLTADLLTLHYAEHRGACAMTVRPVNHTGPGQSASFAIPAFAARVAAIDAGEAEPVLRVGNLESTRDILDVRDTARAYRLLLERGRAGRAYNLAGGRSVRLGDALERLCALAGIAPRIETDPGLFRPTDHSPRLDTARLRADTGWEPVFPLDQTLADVYRAAVQASRLPPGGVRSPGPGCRDGTPRMNPRGS